MAWLSALVALLPLITQLIDIFTKTPAEKRESMLEAFIALLRDVKGGVESGSKTGDYKDLEDVINRARRRR